MFLEGALSEWRRQVVDYAGRFDPAALTGAQAAAVVEDAARIESAAAAVKALAAARAADCGAWDDQGDLSPAHTLARRTGTTVGRARDALRTARRLADQPALDSAMRAGRVSADQAAAISDAAASVPGCEQRLIETARRGSLQELRNEAERVRAAADRNPEETHRRVHAGRYARKRSCTDGSAQITYRATRADIALVWAVVSGYANAAFHAARTAGRREPADAYAADAMVAMAQAAARNGAAEGAQTSDGTNKKAKAPVPTTVICRIDWDALIRGFPLEGQTSEIAGIGPVPVAAIKAIMASGDPFLAAVVTNGRDVVNVAHLGRQPTAHQITALRWAQPRCTVAGCDQTARLEKDHRIDWADSHITLLSLLDHLRRHHHNLKTRENWALAEGHGKRPMVPPHHPDHPRNNPARAPAQPRAG